MPPQKLRKLEPVISIGNYVALNKHMMLSRGVGGTALKAYVQDQPGLLSRAKTNLGNKWYPVIL